MPVTVLPPELWIEVFEWASHNPFLDVNQSHSPFQPIPTHDNIRDPNLNVRLTISLVCRQWRLWVARLLYSDIKIKDHNGASGLRKALERPTTADGYHGQMVRRVILQYSSTVPGPSNHPMQSIEILKLCPHIHTLLRPRFSGPSLYFDYEVVGLPLPALQRLEWWHYDEAERSGGINSLAAVLHAAPNLSYLFVGGVISFSRICTQKEIPSLPHLQTLRISAINGLLLHQIVSRWSLPSLRHIIVDSLDLDWGLIWDAFGNQLKSVEFGKHLRFFTCDRLSACLNGCPGLEELNFYLYFTSPVKTIQPHNSLTTVRIHSAFNGLLFNDAAIWDLIHHHFEFLCGSNLPALRHIILYGDWQLILDHPRFTSIRDKLRDIDRILEVSH